MRLATHIMAIGLVAVAMLAFVACGDRDDERSPRSPTAQPTAPADPVPGRSGIERIDQIIAAVEAGDVDAFVDLLLWEAEACEAPAQGLGGPPTCEEGEAPGTAIRVVPFASCEGYWLREGTVRQALTPFVDGTARLYAVYRASDGRLFDRHGDYAVIFETTGGPAGPMAREVIMTEAGVVGVNLGCGQSAEQLVEFQGLVDAIVEPAEARTQ